MGTVVQGRKGEGAGIRLCVLAALCCLLLAGGCASRQGGSGGGGASFSVPDDDPTPLSPKEVAALNSTGHVDKSLPPEAMDDVARQYKYFLRKATQFRMCVLETRGKLPALLPTRFFAHAA